MPLDALGKVESPSPGTVGAYVVSLLRDPNTGDIWVGTEEKGVWRYHTDATNKGVWTQFTTHDGLGDDNAYALVCDHQGRIWVGHQRNGVSVYNGHQWRNYTSGKGGPIGSRVFAMDVNVTNGDLWVATESGLSRYSPTSQTWTQYTRANGLPSQQISSLSFGPDGTLYVGLQTDGIAIASARTNYMSWEHVQSNDDLPNSPSGGKGLPSNMINCVLAGHKLGAVYAGTPDGLAFSLDYGRTWTFWRGADWQAKIRGKYKPVTLAANDDNAPEMKEDYVTCLAEDWHSGMLYIGHHIGLDICDMNHQNTFLPVTGATNVPINFTAHISSVITLGDSTALAGIYRARHDNPLMIRSNHSNGFALLPIDGLSSYTGIEDARAIMALTTHLPTAQLPQVTPLPSPTELNHLRVDVRQQANILNVNTTVPPVTLLDDDWTTRGDWQGRYGRYWACLAAISSFPKNYIWQVGWNPVNYYMTIGPNHAKDDQLRYWVHWLYTTNPNSLELPTTYLDSRVRRKLTTWSVNRREAEVDDHGEAYPFTMEGPNLYVNITIPSGGPYMLSLYDFNKDGHATYAARRDYRVSLRMHSATPLTNIDDFADQIELAHTRIYQFRCGVWKRFLVKGPAALTIEINKNYSNDTILPGVMLDLLDEKPAPYFASPEHWEADQLRKKTRAFTHSLSEPQPTNALAAADLLFDDLELLRLRNPTWWSAESKNYYTRILRIYEQERISKPNAKPTDQLLEHLGSCYYATGQYELWEACLREKHIVPARDLEKSLRYDGVTDIPNGFKLITNARQVKAGK